MILEIMTTTGYQLFILIEKSFVLELFDEDGADP